MVDISSTGYQITNAKTPILLTIHKTRDLKPHEETVQVHLETILRLLSKEPVLRHPIVADRKTGLVLDGTHRLEAIKKLGCKLAPCAMVDYQNSRIKVDRWFRAIEQTNVEEFKGIVGPLAPRYKAPSGAEKCISSRSCYASIEDDRSCMVFPATNKDPVELARASFEIERTARLGKLKISYVDSKALRPSNGIILSSIRLKKHEVMDTVKEHRIFPPKTTRHVIPSRPLGIGVPLSWLRGTSLKQAQARFLSHLMGKKITRKPPGSLFGSRRYQEEIIVFE